MPLESKASTHDIITAKLRSSSCLQGGWFEDRACNCLRHLRDCERQPREVRERARKEHETRHLAPRRVTARRPNDAVRAADSSADPVAEGGPLSNTAEEPRPLPGPEDQPNTLHRDPSPILSAHHVPIPVRVPPEMQHQMPVTAWYCEAPPPQPTSSPQNVWQDTQDAVFESPETFVAITSDTLPSTSLGATWDPQGSIFADFLSEPPADASVTVPNVVHTRWSPSRPQGLYQTGQQSFSWTEGGEEPRWFPLHVNGTYALQLCSALDPMSRSFAASPSLVLFADDLTRYIVDGTVLYPASFASFGVAFE
ncbi:hypothetical protein PsYK624_147670 [Phanerochaete sordida]|uniref:Uncharacterized protein n=1 Tax=Phanerochaete sordida TaxID=48140 RepID=A0A9P3GS92_9APHY|nr:hypothetical protein PsYK624_147670 [Phanerochaete sordida]